MRMIRYCKLKILILFVVFLSNSSAAQQDRHIDSLFQLFKSDVVSILETRQKYFEWHADVRCSYANLVNEASLSKLLNYTNDENVVVRSSIINFILNAYNNDLAVTNYLLNKHKYDTATYKIKNVDVISGWSVIRLARLIIDNPQNDEAFDFLELVYKKCLRAEKPHFYLEGERNDIITIENATKISKLSTSLPDLEILEYTILIVNNGSDPIVAKTNGAYLSNEIIKSISLITTGSIIIIADIKAKYRGDMRFWPSLKLYVL